MLMLRRETDTNQNNMIKIYDRFNNWLGTIKVMESTNDSAVLGCIGPDSTKFLRGEAKMLRGKKGRTYESVA